MSVRSIRQTGTRILVFCLAVYGSSGMIFGDGPWLTRLFSSLAASLVAYVWIIAMFLFAELLAGRKE